MLFRSDQAWLGRRIFAFNPHERLFAIAADDAIPLPDELPSDLAVLLPNMETAVSLVMDGRPVIGERVAIFGQGVVGLLTTLLLAQMPLASLNAIDPLDSRQNLARTFGATSNSTPTDADLVYELSGNPNALNDAISAAGYAGRVVVGSWYGRKQATLDLGGAFHRSHVRLISSQVSTLHPRWRGRWTKRRRLQFALEQLTQLRPNALITHRIPFANAPEAYRLLDQSADQALQVVLTYD